MDTASEKEMIHLSLPQPTEIQQAYRELSTRGCVLITCTLERLPETLVALEDAGFVGMLGRRLSAGAPSFDVMAYKGKQAPCYDTGKSARYTGAAHAVLDDDNHILYGQIKVCEKTARLYGLPPFKGLIEISAGDKALLERLDSNPQAFDCDTFEQDTETLVASLSTPASNIDPDRRGIYLYPGPFRMLILKDGSMVRRGQAVQLDRDVAKTLQEKDGLLEVKEALEAEAPENYSRLFQNAGTLCLLNPKPPQATRSQTDFLDGPHGPDWHPLQYTAPELKARLLKMIERGDPYFLLTGSDPRDLESCCPSDGVGAANLLAEAGVLDSLRQPAPPDACPVTIYAFPGEISHGAGGPSFNIKPDIRASIRKVLLGGRDGPAQKIVRWVLLVFVFISLGFAFSWGPEKPADTVAPLTESLDLPVENCVVVGFFSGTAHCAFCDNIRNFSEATLKAHFEEALATQRIVFRVRNTDLQKYRHFKDRYDLFTASVVLIKVKNGRASHSKVLEGAWDLFDDEKRFVEMLQSELLAFMKDTP